MARQIPRMADDGDATSARKAAEAPAGDIRSEIERVLGELQERLSEAADDAEDIIAAHPFASVAAAFLLGVLVANVMSRGK